MRPFGTLSDVSSTDTAAAERAYANAPNLDVLRAFAALLVVFTHVSVFFGVAGTKPFGRAAVYLFFVHTCLVLMLSMSRHVTAQRGRWVLAFYVRRVFRIYPLSMVVVLAVAAFAIPVFTIPKAWTMIGAPLDGKAILSNLALVMNITGHTQVMGPLWSLVLEVQMYLLLPVAWLIARRWGWRPVLALTLASVAVAVYVERATTIRPDNLINFVPYFMPGVLAYTMLGRRPLLPAWLWLPFVVALVFGFRASPTTYTGCAMCLVLGVSIPAFHQLRDGALARAGHVIARYSYGIYLSHPISIWLAFKMLPAPLPVQVAAFAALLVIIPVAAYHVVEAPLVRIGARLADRIGARR